MLSAVSARNSDPLRVLQGYGKLMTTPLKVAATFCLWFMDAINCWKGWTCSVEKHRDCLETISHRREIGDTFDPQIGLLQCQISILWISLEVSQEWIIGARFLMSNAGFAQCLFKGEVVRLCEAAIRNATCNLCSTTSLPCTTCLELQVEMGNGWKLKWFDLTHAVTKDYHRPAGPKYRVLAVVNSRHRYFTAGSARQKCSTGGSI